MNELLGRFYLRLTSNGNLTGEFSNNRNNRVQTESADRHEAFIGEIKSPAAFVGTFDSTWFEPEENSPAHAILVINPHPDNCQIFNLEWTVQGGDVVFRGQGMVAEGLLIGDYQMVQQGQVGDEFP